METVGYATLQIIPSTRGFAPALTGQTAAPVAAAGKTAGKGFGASMLGMAKGFGPILGVTLGVAAVSGFVKGAVNLEKEFSQTMNTLGAVANVPKAQLEELSDLAVEFGQKTVFSTNEAADAMLELAKGGLTTAQIKAGALDSTLTLAAASGASLEFSATTLANTLNTFGLKATQATEVTAALAGGANASTASIESLAQALAQVGPGAVDAGLSIQETTAALAAFDNAGVKGSDAGTSLKTFLARLVPATDKAGGAFADLGLKMTDSEGNFISLAAMAQELKEGVKGLSDEERTAALNAAFGSDARRAAIILAEEGAAGIAKLTKATSDQDAAQRVADARMKGTAGALEQLSGSWETLQLAVGQVLKPITKFVALGLTDVVNAITPYVTKLADAMGGKGGGLGEAGGVVSDVFESIAPALSDFAKTAIPAIMGVVDSFRNDFLPAVLDFADAVAPIVKWIAVELIGTLGVLFETFYGVIRGVYKVLSGLLNFVTGVLTGDWSKAWQGIKQIFGGVWDAIFAILRGIVKLIIVKVKSSLTAIRAVWSRVWGWIKDRAAAVWNGIKSVISRAISAVVNFVRSGFEKVRSWIASVLDKIREFVSNAWSRVREIFSTALSRIVETVREKGSAVLEWFRELPGKIRDLFSNAGSWLIDAGKNIVQGLLDGAGSLLPSVGQFFLDKLPGWIQGPFKKALGIESPSKVFAGFGENISEGLAIGVEKSSGKPRRAVEQMIGVPKAPSIRSNGGVFGAAGSGGPAVRQPVELVLDGRKIAETVFEIGGREATYGRRGY